MVPINLNTLLLPRKLQLPLPLPAWMEINRNDQLTQLDSRSYQLLVCTTGIIFFLLLLALLLYVGLKWRFQTRTPKSSSGKYATLADFDFI